MNQGHSILIIISIDSRLRESRRKNITRSNTFQPTHLFWISCRLKHNYCINMFSKSVRFIQMAFSAILLSINEFIENNAFTTSWSLGLNDNQNIEFWNKFLGTIKMKNCNPIITYILFWSGYFGDCFCLFLFVCLFAFNFVLFISLCWFNHYRQ